VCGDLGNMYMYLYWSRMYIGTYIFLRVHKCICRNNPDQNLAYAQRVFFKLAIKLQLGTCVASVTLCMYIHGHACMYVHMMLLDSSENVNSLTVSGFQLPFLNFLLLFLFVC
jgi:hypothetical protein